MSRVRVPVLTWHSMSMDGPDYATNDHVAFAEDLRTIDRLGLRIVPLAAVAKAAVEGGLDALEGCIALSFDDGADSDYLDFPHPRWGPQRSMRNILADFRVEAGDSQPSLHATAFAIASPDARAGLDRSCMHGCGWWNDEWWADAEREGLLAIESHSWDHNHDGLTQTAARVRKGAFALTSRADADAEIAQASRYIAQRRGREGDVLFAYPYGPASDFLACDYFPDASANHGVYAAFTTEPRPVSSGESRWALPRYVCRSHWRSPEELERLIEEAGAKPSSGAPMAAARNARPRSWREHFRTWEVRQAKYLAGDLFQHSFGHRIPDYPRHFVLLYSPPHDAVDTTPCVVAYVHQMPFEGAYLTGGLCVDEGIYRALPREIFAKLREAGGLATLIMRDSFSFLDGSAVFGRVGDLRSLAATKRAGYDDAGRPPLIVHWLKPLPDERKKAILDRVEAHGHF